MHIKVMTRAVPGGDPEPASFAIGTRELQVDEVLDRWPGRLCDYFKIAASDGARYILRHATEEGEWELVWFSAD
ncbi:MAG TPA: hypothetical protein VM406_08050 [Noviherbaspirillum sp.]|nr:hypothetical protein [Noviherbaspirillum sp.]